MNRTSDLIIVYISKHHYVREGDTHSKVIVHISPIYLNMYLQFLHKMALNAHCHPAVCIHCHWRTQGGFGGFKLPPKIPKF
jgi:hypothetical protein